MVTFYFNQIIQTQNILFLGVILQEIIPPLLESHHSEMEIKPPSQILDRTPVGVRIKVGMEVC